MKDKKEFGFFIKTKRIEKNLTQKELADQLLVTESEINKWERGISYPDITLITSICQVLDITEHELIESSNDNAYRLIKKDAIKYNKLKSILFKILNISYIIALLTCFVVNISVNHTLSWFFIVLSAILCGYSFCPGFMWIFKKNKLSIHIISTFISMFILFLTCSIYTNNYWFMIPTCGLLVLYFVIYYPIIFSIQKNFLTDKKYKKFKLYFLLSYSAGIFIFMNLLLISIYCYTPYNIALGFFIVLIILIIPISVGFLNIFNNTKKLIKPLMLTLTTLLLVFIILIIIRSFYINSKSYQKTYTIEESYDNIEINLNEYNINIIFSKTNEDKIISYENTFNSIKYNIIDNTLKIEQIDNRKFYDKAFNFTKYRIDLYISTNTLNDLNINSSTGDISIPSDFIFNNVKINTSTSDIISSAEITNNLDIKTSTGDVVLNNSIIKNNVNIELSTGDIEIVNSTCSSLNITATTGNVLLKDTTAHNNFNMKSSTSSLDFENFDALNIYVSLSTGDVNGTLKSEKNFTCKSNTGKVIVPNTKNGGECIITVSTGNINIHYE